MRAVAAIPAGDRRAQREVTTSAESLGYASALATGMFKAISNVAGEITTQYILRYIPEGEDSKKAFRNISVKVDLANVKVRARKGYYPSNP